MATPSTASSRSVVLRLLAVVAAFVTAFVLTGCSIELALDTTVENDGSGTVGIRMAADKEIQDLIAQQGQGEDIFAGFEEQMPEGWEVDSGSDADGTRWVTATTSFADLDEFQQILQSGSGGVGEAFSGQQITLTQDRGLFTTKTKFAAEWDAGSALSSAGSELPEGVDMSMLSSIFQIQNRLTLPGSIGENNADEVDGSTLIWSPAMTGVTSMTAESTSYNWGLLIGIVVAGLVVLIIVIVVLFVLLRRKSPEQPPAGAEAPSDAAAAEAAALAGGVAAAAQTPPGAPQAAVPTEATDALWAQPTQQMPAAPTDAAAPPAAPPAPPEAEAPPAAPPAPPEAEADAAAPPAPPEAEADAAAPPTPPEAEADAGAGTPGATRD